MDNFWNERYGVDEYVYGDQPNVFFAEQLRLISPGTLILPCEGEGRNAVYAASLGWKVHAFDSSEAGKQKAMRLAERIGTTFEYDIVDANDANYLENSADVVAFVYAHFPPMTRKSIHQKAMHWLKPGGRLLLEAFHPSQLQNQSGGPKALSMLYSEDMIKADFAGLHVEIMASIETTLSEGKYHEGKAHIVRYLGVK